MSFLLVKPIYNTRKLHRGTEFLSSHDVPVIYILKSSYTISPQHWAQGQILEKRIQFMEKKVVEETK